MNPILTQMHTRSPEEVFSIDPRDAAQMQLESLKERFDELRPRIPGLNIVADDVGVDSIDQLEDVVPLCLPHTTYKSYSAKHIDSGRYDRLTQWLDGWTSEDLSTIDVSGCDSLESWLDALEAKSNLYVTVSSGTTGKVSFFPRGDREAEIFVRYVVQTLSGFRDEPDAGLATGEPEWFAAFPMATGRQNFPRMFQLLQRYVYGGDPSRMHTLGKGHWDADMLWLWGRIRSAEARGENFTGTLTPALERVRERVQGELDTAAANSAQFLRELVEDFRGKRILVFGPRGSLINLASMCKERGLQPELGPGSFIFTGGASGSKGDVFPEGWEQLLDSVFPPPHSEVYGMTELTTACRLCSAHWFHLPHTVIPFLLDPDTSLPLPRTGVVTGRLAVFDLNAETYWGGTITGDRVTIDWDGGCPCGRLGARINYDVTRYTQLQNDDKITCAKSPGAYERAVDTLMSMN